MDINPQQQKQPTPNLAAESFLPRIRLRHADQWFEQFDRGALFNGLSKLTIDAARAVVTATDSAIVAYFAAKDDPQSASAELKAIGKKLGLTDLRPGAVLGQFSHQKGRGDFVTVMDHFLDTHLQRALQRVVEAPVISEEAPTKLNPFEIHRCWVLDPLDGTLAYMFGNQKHTGPMVTYMEHGEPRFSVTMNMAGTRLGIAERGHGARTINYTESINIMSSHHPGLGATHLSLLEASRVILNPQSDVRRSHPLFRVLSEALARGSLAQAVETPLPASQLALDLDYSRLAAVIHDNSHKHVKQQLWDVLPMQLWVEEAGGAFLGFDGKRYDPRNPMPIVAATDLRTAHHLLAVAHRRTKGRPFMDG